MVSNTLSTLSTNLKSPSLLPPAADFLPPTPAAVAIVDSSPHFGNKFT